MLWLCFDSVSAVVSFYLRLVAGGFFVSPSWRGDIVRFYLFLVALKREKAHSCCFFHNENAPLDGVNEIL